MAKALLDALFSELTAPKLASLLRSELSQPQMLDQFLREKENKRAILVQGPRKIFHIFSSNIPGAAVTSFILGLVVQSQNIGKTSERDAGFLRIYLDSLKAHDPELGKRCRLIRADDRMTAARCMRRADLVVAYGSEESLKEIQKNIPARTPFIRYGHKISFSLLTKEVLSPRNAKRLADRTAHDVWMADQRGCLSPSTVFVQKGGKIRPERFSELIANALGGLEKSEPMGPRRGLSEFLHYRRDQEQALISKIKNKKALVWQSQVAARWTVLYDGKPELVSSGPGQRISVKGFRKLEDLRASLRHSGPSLQAAALECAGADRAKLARWLSRFGVNRVCRAGRLQHPPLTWHHDGRPNLADWLHWTDLED